MTALFLSVPSTFVWLVCAPLAIADESARVLKARIGRTEQGIPRFVVETDRPVSFLAVELTGENGFELHLESAALGGASAPRPAAAVREVTFHPSATGLIARVLLDETRRVGCAYALTNPPRIVLDLPAKDGRVNATSPRRKLAPRVDATGSRGKFAQAAKPPLKVRVPFAHSSALASPAASRKPARPVDPELAELLAFAQGLRDALDTILAAEVPATASTARRALSRQLAGRGLFAEAENVLRGGRLEDGAAHAVEDSLDIAELRHRRGDFAAGLEIAAQLDPARMSDAQRVRLARVLLESGAPRTVSEILEPVRATADPSDRARATQLTAKSLWDLGQPADALALVAEIAHGATTPQDVVAPAVLLEADCLFALARPADARRSYERAAQLGLGSEESSWTALQLGNLARREGRFGDARRHYETAKAYRPETFYAAQADWFLRFDTRLSSSRPLLGGKTRG